MFIGRTDAEAEAPILRPPDAKSRLTGEKSMMLGKIEGMNKRRATNSMDMSLSKLLKIVKNREASHAAVHSHRVSNSWT